MFPNLENAGTFVDPVKAKKQTKNYFLREKV